MENWYDQSFCALNNTVDDIMALDSSSNSDADERLRYTIDGERLLLRLISGDTDRLVE